MLAHAELTERIIGGAIAVHRTLGPGFLESIYEKSLVVELTRTGLGVERQVDVPIQYQGVEVGIHRLDLLVNSLIVVELKATRALEDIHFATTRSYLRALNLEHGLLLNFNKPTLEIKRVMTRDR